jgi:hypothetical protein
VLERCAESWFRRVEAIGRGRDAVGSFFAGEGGYHGEMGLHNKCKHCLGDGGVCRRVKLTNSVILLL